MSGLRSSGERSAIENEWLRSMVDAVDDPVVVTDAGNDIIMQNRRAETVFRVNAGDSEGKRHAIALNNVLFTAFLSAWNLESGADRSESELTLVDPIEGTELYFEVLSYPVTHYRLGGARGVVSVLRNVTDLRRASEQLSENVQRLQSADEEIRLERDRLEFILRSVPFPLLVTDEGDEIVRTNAEALRLFRATPTGTPPAGGADAPEGDADALMGGAEARRQQITLGNDARLSSFLAQLRLEPGQVKRGELALLDPDSGEPLTMWATATEVRDDLGAIAGVVTLLQDLAPIRELERRRVQEALFESEKLAATGRLAASIAHEINNPLEAIKNALYLLVNRIPKSDPNYRFLDIARQETERVSRVLRQLLGFYRPDTSLEATDLNGLILEAVGLLEPDLHRRGVRVQTRLGRDLPLIRASADQLKQVLLNLLINAQQAMPQGGAVGVATEHGAARGAEGAAPGRQTRCASSSRTAARGSPRRTSPTSSSPSSPPSSRKAPAWGCGSRPGSCSATAVASSSAAVPAGGRPSPSSCRWVALRPASRPSPRPSPPARGPLPPGQPDQRARPGARE